MLPAGLTHLAFDPPPGMPNVGLERFNVAVHGTTLLGAITLQRGISISATVTGPGAVPVSGADIDVDTSPGNVSVYTPNDTTNGSGQFSVVVPPGTYRVSVAPPFSKGLVGQRTAPQTFNVSTTLPNINLAAGVALSGTVTGWNNAPEQDADIDVAHPGDRRRGDHPQRPTPTLQDSMR